MLRRGALRRCVSDTSDQDRLRSPVENVYDIDIDIDIDIVRREAFLYWGNFRLVGTGPCRSGGGGMTSFH